LLDYIVKHGSAKKLAKLAQKSHEFQRILKIPPTELNRIKNSYYTHWMFGDFIAEVRLMES
jgi:hypothetical protein